MEIKRFDKLEHDCLKYTHPDNFGYNHFDKYVDKYVERILILMKEGIIYTIKRNKFKIFECKLTKKGIKYSEVFLKILRNTHGHIWKTHKDCYPEDYEDSKYGKKINFFVLSKGIHNGPECKKCGFLFCEHCISEFDINECDKK